MKKYTSEKKLGDKVVKVSATCDLEAVIAKHGMPRVEELFGGWAVAHSLAEALKRAYSPDIKGEAAQKRAAEMRKRVDDGEVFDVSEFLPSPRGVDKVVLMIREKWEASDKKAQFLKAYKLPEELEAATAEEVEAAYLAQKDEDVSL